MYRKIKKLVDVRPQILRNRRCRIAHRDIVKVTFFEVLRLFQDIVCTMVENSNFCSGEPAIHAIILFITIKVNALHS